MIVIWTFVIAILTALACALAGVLLVVKREAFISEGLSHAVLPGIILAFLAFGDRNSPLLIISAALSGLLMVWLVQLIAKTGLVDKDAALGIVFSGMFSVGIIASSLKLKNVHFHAHCIIDGELATATLHRFEIGGVYLGPRAFVVMAVALLAMVVFIVVFYKELKLMAFDESASQLLGFRPRLLHTLWLALVSIVAVAAFKTAGTILVVALMIAPPAAANLLTSRLSTMMLISGLLGAVGAALGVWLGLALEIAHTGPIASVAGMIFLAIVLLAPGKGLVSKWILVQRQRKELLRLISLKQKAAGQTTHSATHSSAKPH